MTKCKHDDGDCYCDQYNAEMTMTDSLQTIIDDLHRRGRDTDNTAHAVWYLHYAGRLEALQKQPVAYMTHHDEPMLFLTEQEAASYCEDDEKPNPLIRGD